MGIKQRQGRGLGGWVSNSAREGGWGDGYKTSLRKGVGGMGIKHPQRRGMIFYIEAKYRGGEAAEKVYDKVSGFLFDDKKNRSLSMPVARISSFPSFPFGLRPCLIAFSTQI
jgi:hypothetical protein